VPALAPLLRDAKATDAARFALEPVPGPAADAAFRDALPALKGNAKAGLIGSIAVRGDAAARPALATLKDNPAEPPIVRTAAARALERLASPRS
jgi:HEAT repeat protein